jgi:hypothetical protein
LNSQSKLSAGNCLLGTGILNAKYGGDLSINNIPIDITPG